MIDLVAEKLDWGDFSAPFGREKTPSQNLLRPWITRPEGNTTQKMDSEMQNVGKDLRKAKGNGSCFQSRYIG
jgi:hypothetical protein